MEQVSLTYFYNLGSVLHPVAELEYDRKNRGYLFGACYRLEPYVRGLLEYYSRLQVCRIPGINLINAINVLREWFNENTPDKWNGVNFDADVKVHDFIVRPRNLRLFCLLNCRPW